jgi:hypothetical protein
MVNGCVFSGKGVNCINGYGCGTTLTVVEEVAGRQRQQQRQ